MSSFVLPAALLVLLAVAFAVAVLWQSSRRLALAIAIGLPLAAIALYAWRGTPAALEPGATAPAEPPATIADAAETASVQEQVEAALAEVRGRIAANPDDWEALAQLGNIHMQLQQFDEARDAFAKAHAVQPDNHTIAISYAESLLRTSQDRRFPPEAVALLERAAKASPPDERGVFFLGVHLMQSGKPGEAADLWESLIGVVEANTAASLRRQIDAARAAQAQLDGGAAPVAPAAPAEGGPTIAVTIDIHPTLKARAPAGSVLYVFARRAGVGGPPVAVERVLVDKWPVTLTLSDADSVMPTAKLSGVPRVDVVARLAHAGDAMASSGDLESDAVGAVAGDELRLVLTKVRP